MRQRKRCVPCRRAAYVGGGIRLRSGEGGETVSMQSYFWIALGGALGSVARFWCSGVVARQFGETFPWGTLLINVLGSFAIGFFATATGTEGRWFVPLMGRQFFVSGVCSGDSMFSTFS